MASVCAAAFQRPQFGKGVDRPISSGEAGTGLLRRYGKGRVILRHDLIGGCPKQPEHQKCDKQNTGYRGSNDRKDTLAAGVFAIIRQGFQLRYTPKPAISLMLLFGTTLHLFNRSSVLFCSRVKALLLLDNISKAKCMQL